MRLWDIKGNSTEIVRHTDGVMSIAFSLDENTYIATGSRDQTTRIWDARSGELSLKPFEGHGNDIQLIVYSSDGYKFVYGGSGISIKLFLF